MHGIDTIHIHVQLFNSEYSITRIHAYLCHTQCIEKLTNFNQVEKFQKHMNIVTIPNDQKIGEKLRILFKRIVRVQRLQAAISTLESRIVKSSLVRECRRVLHALCSQNRMALCWVPRHNEMADTLACKGSEDTNMETIDVYKIRSLAQRKI